MNEGKERRMRDEIDQLRQAVSYYHAVACKQRPMYVPDVVTTAIKVAGDPPIGHRNVAHAGTHPATCNEWGAVSVMGTEGMLGLRLDEFTPVRFRLNESATCKGSSPCN